MRHEYLKLSIGDKVNFECLMCGRCCSSGPNVGLTAFDIHRIAQFLGENWRNLKGKYVVAVIADRIAIPVLRDKGNGRCVFLEFRNGEAFCRIYPARPMRCRLYPFIPYSPGNNEIIYLDKCCPGLKANKLIEPPWEILENCNFEAKLHYSELYRLVFREGLEPLEALERTIEKIAKLAHKTTTLKNMYGEHLRNVAVCERDKNRQSNT